MSPFPAIPPLNGGGIDISESPGVLLHNSIVYGNSATGSGIHKHNCSLSLSTGSVNNLIGMANAAPR